jgi:penicillin-binding protein 1B
MTRPPHRTIVAAITLFLVASAAANVSLAGIYVRGAARLRSASGFGERDVRILARPLRLAIGDRLSKEALEEHLRRIGYYSGCAGRGCYAADDRSLTIWSRYPEIPDVTIGWFGDAISRIATPAGDAIREGVVEPETLATLMNDPDGSASRARNQPLPVSAVAGTPLLDAIIASEDQWFTTHHGIDFGRLALVPLVGGGASTITMQVARVNVLEDRSRTLSRKLSEIGTAMVLERVYSKDEIMAAYVNTVDLGARRGRPLHGFGAAADEFFGVSDVRMLTPVQAATLVALLNQPSRYLDDLQGGDDTRLRRQRNRVLRLMHRNFSERYPSPLIAQFEKEGVQFVSPVADEDLQRASRHFLDYAAPSLPHIAHGRIYVTLDARLQRIATETVANGLVALQQRTWHAATPQLQGALIAIDPERGDVLAMVGGRSYEDSQFNRSASAARQVGSIMKPFDYLAALEHGREGGFTALSPDTIVTDVPTVFTFPGRRPWRPVNYNRDYAGAVTWRRALAESRNVAAVKVAALAGIDRVAKLWEAASGQQLHDVPPALALGAIEATPAQVARAYAVFATGGVTTPLRTVTTVVSGDPYVMNTTRGRRVAAAGSIAQVTDMMRSVIDEGTARGARAAGLTVDAAGKTGTTNDLRDAWFAGFTSRLLAVVWVGRDDNAPLGLTGAQAALPIWTEFIKRAMQPQPAAAPMEVTGEAVR